MYRKHLKYHFWILRRKTIPLELKKVERAATHRGNRVTKGQIIQWCNFTHSLILHFLMYLIFDSKFDLLLNKKPNSIPIMHKFLIILYELLNYEIIDTFLFLVLWFVSLGCTVFFCEKTHFSLGFDNAAFVLPQLNFGMWPEPITCLNQSLLL